MTFTTKPTGAPKMDGEKFADRDRHHSAVRRRLGDLQAMGLLVWRVGADVSGEDGAPLRNVAPAAKWGSSASGAGG